jgi:Stress responsive A/B Barrel Domain
MKRISIYLCLAITILVMSSSFSQAQKKSSAKVLRHVVLFKFQDSAKPEDVKKVGDAFIALKGKIKLIKDFEWGTNTFASDKDRDAYLVHPDHQAFVEVLKPHLDKVTVIDYWTK